jgi:hypothetical protein
MDIKLIETGNGGDIQTLTKDVLIIYGFENMPYLALFGGNVEASTPQKRLETQQAFDFWGNSILTNDPSIQFNSETERVLNTTPLTSSGRQLILQAIKKDLEFMREFARVGVAVSIVSTDKVVIGIALQQPDNLQERRFIYIWDATQNELTLQDSPIVQNAQRGGFDYILDFDFE